MNAIVEGQLGNRAGITKRTQMVVEEFKKRGQSARLATFVTRCVIDAELRRVLRKLQSDAR